ncbi:MAG: hypothetical protein JWM12_43 [Ilumatobacteraceae bacterium]|nr:hypothetical protein [Ilumatobacteraceae bacterium]
MRQPAGYPRRHGTVLEPDDRRHLERAGWRTTLDYRENHVRSRSGQLLEVVAVWTAEAERFDDHPASAHAVGATADEAWLLLREEIAAHRVQLRTSRVRVVRS